MLNDFFNFAGKLGSTNVKTPNRKALKTFNYLYYLFCTFLYNIISIFIYPFQRKFINLYTAHLELNRLPFRIIPNSFKKFLIYTATMELWLLFFKRIKHHNNLYILREKKNSLLYRLWCLYYKDSVHYYNELNIKRQFSREISNFYNKTKKHKTKDERHNVITFYYFNKMILTNYPYYYWAYIFIFNKYNYNTRAVLKSQHNRTVLFFLFAKSIKRFYAKKKTLSFVKVTLNTFKGVRNTLKSLKSKQSGLVPNKRILPDVILQARSEYENLFERKHLKYYNIFFKKKKVSNSYKFHINNLIHKNTFVFLQSVQSKIKSNITFLKIMWYNKVHNSVINSKKNNLILYLRAPKHFNKGRYSRNRQLYRTGVYWCIWLNVVIVYALHYYFYRVVFSFGYLWLPLGLMILVMFSSRLYKYRYYSLYQIFIEFKEFNNFLFFFLTRLNYFFRNNTYTSLVKLKNLFVTYSYLLIKAIETKIKRTSEILK